MIDVVVKARDSFPFHTKEVLVTSISAPTLLEALAKLHEQLNAVAMPRVHQEAFRNTAGRSVEEALFGLRSPDGLPVTISC